MELLQKGYGLRSPSQGWRWKMPLAQNCFLIFKENHGIGEKEKAPNILKLKLLPTGMKSTISRPLSFIQMNLHYPPGRTLRHRTLRGRKHTLGAWLRPECAGGWGRGLRGGNPAFQDMTSSQPDPSGRAAGLCPKAG